MDNSCKPWEIVTEVLTYLEGLAKPGISKLELDDLGHQKIIELGGIPYNLGYKPDWAPTPFPNAICICVNDEICHGIPNDYVLQDGDLVSFDVGVQKDGVCGDAALTVGVGEISSRDKRLLWNALKTLYAAIDVVKAGALTTDISQAIQAMSTREGYTTNYMFCGHAIGAAMHEEPKIANFYYPGMEESELKAGQMICIEPMITYTDKVGVKKNDGWTFKTKDGKKSAFFEHQLLVTEGGCEVLTKHISKDKKW